MIYLYYTFSLSNMATRIGMRCKILNCFPFLPLSTIFLFFPALSSPWVNERKEPKRKKWRTYTQASYSIIILDK